MGKQLAPDDDPKFAAWIRDVGPIQEMPVREPASAVLAAIALVAATVGMGAAVGIALALVMGSVTMIIAMLLMAGGVVVAVCALSYLVVQAT